MEWFLWTQGRCFFFFCDWKLKISIKSSCGDESYFNLGKNPSHTTKFLLSMVFSINILIFPTCGIWSALWAGLCHALIEETRQCWFMFILWAPANAILRRNSPAVLDLGALLSFFWGPCSSVGSVCRDVRRIWEEKHRGGGVRDRTQMIYVLRETWQVCILTSSECKCWLRIYDYTNELF